MTGPRVIQAPLGAAVPAATIVFCLSVLLAAPSVFWLDSGNLVASAWTMGLAHPPGEPLWLALARIAQLIPVGDIAFRTSLLSALCLAVCVFPLVMLLQLVEGGAGGSRRLQLLSVGLVVIALVGFSAQLQAGRPEVYSMTTLLLSLALLAAVLGGLRSWAFVGLFLGLGIGLHPLLCAAATPALVLALVLRPGQVRALVPRWGHLVAGVLGGLAGLGILAWLPLRAIANPAAAWGVPDTAERFVDVLLARNFSRNFGGGSSSLFDNAGVILDVWLGTLLPVLLVLLLLPLLRRERIGRRAGVWAGVVVLWMIGNASTILPQNKVFSSNPDLHGYLLIGALGVLPLAYLGLRSVPRWSGALVGLVLLLQVGQGLKTCAADNFLARTFATAQAAGLPSGATLMTSGNDTAFTWTYLQRVERRRVDLTLIHRVLVGHENELLRLGGREELQVLGLSWEPSLRDRPADQLGGAKRAFFIERREAEQTAFMEGSLVRHGLMASSSSGDDRWLVAVRAAVINEFQEPSLAFDAEARLVLSYYLELWREGR